MKKLFQLFIFPLLIFMSVFSISGQSLQEKIKNLQHKTAYKVEYDKSKDRTRVRFGELPINRANQAESVPETVLLGASFSFEGEYTIGNDGEFDLHFQSFCPQWCFQENHSLVFFTGIEKIDLGEGAYNGKVGRGRGKDVTETITYKVNCAQLIALADAGVSEFKLGAFESVLNDDHKHMLKNVLDLGTCR